jgi:hypothetical protein
VNLVDLKLKDIVGADAALDEGGVDDEVDAEVAAEDETGEGVEAAEQEVLSSAEQGNG